MVNGAPPPTADTALRRSARARPRHKRVGEEPPLESYSMAHKIRRLTLDGLDETACQILMPDNNRNERQRRRIQQQYLEYYNNRSTDPVDPSATSLINFLSHGYDQLKWTTSTCTNYHSAILQLYPNDSPVPRTWLYNTFFRRINHNTIHTNNHDNLDITPVLDKLTEWGPNSDLDVARLTYKVCWLLALCGLLRPADIERIDLNHTTVCAQNRLTLHIVAPKETQQGQRVVRTPVISPHPNSLWCPVNDFQAYIARVAHTCCQHPHPVLPTVNINFFIHHILKPQQHVGAQCISNHIAQLHRLVPRPSGACKPKLRAIGATRTVRAGVPINDIMAHGSWASRDVLNNFYRMSLETNSDFTSVALDPQSIYPRSEG